MSTGELAAPSCSTLDLDAIEQAARRAEYRDVVKARRGDRAAIYRRATMVLDLGHVYGVKDAEVVAWGEDTELLARLDTAQRYRLELLAGAFERTGELVGTERTCEALRELEREINPNRYPPSWLKREQAERAELDTPAPAGELAGDSPSCPRCGQLTIAAGVICEPCRQLDRAPQGAALELFDTRPYGAPTPTPTGQGELF